jgi:hypothetical protein
MMRLFLWQDMDVNGSHYYSRFGLETFSYRSDQLKQDMTGRGVR